MIDPLLEKLKHYTDLEKREVRMLRAAPTREKRLENGDYIIKEGENPPAVHLIIDGWACRCKMLSDGREQVMGYLIKGDLCDLHVTLLSRMDHSIRAITTTTVGMVPEESINRIIEDFPRLARALFWSLMVDEAVARHWILNIGLRSAEARVAHLFCELLVRFQIAGLIQGNTLEMPMTQANLGEALSLTPVHINRVLQRLRQKGLIALARKELTVIDPEGLKEVAEFDAVYLHLDKRLVNHKGELINKKEKRILSP
ncbi:Crp/Fnr family transcriptional regulator [Kushneria sp. Sum13]|uniref:Crp/Fnr family transcriptional regulator n=1 Tax=Kushneria sp. Sum13 TaxID=3459196 RepID=UPI0040457B03